MGNPAKRQERAREKRRQSRAQPESANMRAKRLAAERTCGDCQLCCELMAIPELKKPPRQRCSNQCSTGCAIYATRPASCAAFLCLWRQGWGVSADRPDRTGLVIEMKLAVEYPALAEFGGGGTVNGGRYIFGIRTATDEIANSLRVTEVRRSFQQGKNVVTVVSPSRFVLYGPNYPNGHTFTPDEARALEAFHAEGQEDGGAGVRGADRGVHHGDGRSGCVTGGLPGGVRERDRAPADVHPGVQGDGPGRDGRGLAGSNPGALRVTLDLLEKGRADVIAKLTAAGVTGARLWFAYDVACERDMKQLIAAADAPQSILHTCLREGIPAE